MKTWLGDLWYTARGCLAAVGLGLFLVAALLFAFLWPVLVLTLVVMGVLVGFDYLAEAWR